MARGSSMNMAGGKVFYAGLGSYFPPQSSDPGLTDPDETYEKN